MCLMSTLFSKGGFIKMRSKVPRLPFCSRKSPQMVSSATCSNDAANVALISTAVTLPNGLTFGSAAFVRRRHGRHGRRECKPGGVDEQYAGGHPEHSAAAGREHHQGGGQHQAAAETVAIEPARLGEGHGAD